MIDGEQRKGSAAPPPEAFPDCAVGWYVLGRSRDLTSKPIGIELFGNRLVCFRLPSGKAVVLEARCWHMGADLSAGIVVADQIVCPFHGWRYGASGDCESIPGQTHIPMGARQRPYYAADHAGYVFVFPRDATGYPPPFFAGTDPGDLVAAPPFEFLIDCPWWLIGTNGFDLQHFTGLHDRKIVSAPMIESPHPAARRIIATFEICGKSWRDQLTRRFAGLHVTMDVTIWSGTLAFVMAHFHDSPNWDRLDAGATSYGMTEILPIFSPQRTRSRVRVTVFRRRRSGLGLLDRLDARIKRYFIQAFLKPDTLLLAGSRYDPNHMVESDRQMVEYLRWLASASRCRSIPEEHK